MGKVEITKCLTQNDEKRAQKDEKTPFEIRHSNSYFCLFAWRLFVIASFRMTLFCIFVISRGFFSLFRLFVWRFFVFLSRHNAKQNDEKAKKAMRKYELTKRHCAKRRNNKKKVTQKDEITPPKDKIIKRPQAKR